jgi:hypothetical protein
VTAVRGLHWIADEIDAELWEVDVGSIVDEVESVEPDLTDTPLVEVIEPFGQEQLPCTD